mgnify:FL=1
MRKEVEAKLNAQRSLDKLIYRSAHDLRGPVASILGLCNVGINHHDANSINAEKYLGMIESEAFKMDYILDRLFRIQEINLIQIDKQPVDFMALFHEVLDYYNKTPHFNEIDFQLKVENNRDIITDSRLIKVILSNLLENSIKFIDRSKKNKIIATEAGFDDENNSFYIAVQDNGMGIPKELHVQLFDLFTKSSESIKGYGIGLYETKIVANKLGGKITFRSLGNSATEFKVTLPQ